MVFQTFQQIDLNPSLHMFPCSDLSAARRSEGVLLSQNKAVHLFLGYCQYRFLCIWNIVIIPRVFNGSHGIVCCVVADQIEDNWWCWQKTGDQPRGRSGTQQTAFYIIPHFPTSALVRRRSYCTYNYRAGFRKYFYVACFFFSLPYSYFPLLNLWMKATLIRMFGITWPKSFQSC